MRNTQRIVGLIIFLGILLPTFAISQGNGEKAVSKTFWGHVGEFTSKVFTELPRKSHLLASLFFGLLLTLLLAYFVNKKSKKVEKEDGTEITITFINSLLQIRSDKGRRICNIISFVVAFVVLSLVAGAVTVGVTDTGETNAREGRAVPAVVDLPKDEAFKELVASGFKKEEVDEKVVVDSDKKEGIVVKQDPTEGATLDVGSKITLYVSTRKEQERIEVQPVPPGTEIPAPKKVSVPNVVGKKYEAAKAILGRSGLGIAWNRVQRNDKEPGEVTRQEPRPNVSVDRGTTVTVDVCAGRLTCRRCGHELVLDEPKCPSCPQRYHWWKSP